MYPQLIQKTSKRILVRIFLIGNTIEPMLLQNANLEAVRNKEQYSNV